MNLLFWCHRGCWGEAFHTTRQPKCQHCGKTMEPKNESLPEITLKIKLYPSDLGYIARMPTDEDGSLNADAVLELFTGLTAGEAKREVPDHVERYDNDPDYDAFSEFWEQIEKIRRETPEMVLIAHSASE